MVTTIFSLPFPFSKFLSICLPLMSTRWNLPYRKRDCDTILSRAFLSGTISMLKDALIQKGLRLREEIPYTLLVPKISLVERCPDLKGITAYRRETLLNFECVILCWKMSWFKRNYDTMPSLIASFWNHLKSSCWKMPWFKRDYDMKTKALANFPRASMLKDALIQKGLRQH